MYQPEYADIEKLKELTRYFNDSKMFRSLVENHSGSDELISISPNGTELMWKDDMAIISSKIKLGNDSDDARLMVVGPRRMEYGRVVTLMEFITKEIEDMFK